MKKIYLYLRRVMPFFVQIVMFTLTFVGIILLFPHQSRFKYEYSEGKPWIHEDLTAPFDFAVQKSAEEIEKEEQEILTSFIPYFTIDKEVEDTVLFSVSLGLKSYLDDQEISNSVKEKLYTYGMEYGKNVLDSVYAKGILLLKDFPDEFKKEDKNIQYLDGKQLLIRRFDSFYTIEDVPTAISKELANMPLMIDTSQLKSILLRVIEPNILFDKDRSMLERNRMMELISHLKGMVQKGEIIISKGEVVDKEKVQILDTLKSEFEAGADDTLYGHGVLVGQALLLLVSLLIYMLFLMFYHHKEFISVKANFLLLIWLFIMVGITSVVMKFGTVYTYIIPFSLLPITIRALYNQRIAIFASIMTILICSIPVPNHMEFVLMHLFASLVAIISLRKMDNRSQFFISSVIVFITYALMYLGILLFQKQEIGEEFYFVLLIFGGNAVLSMLAIPFIYFFERILGLVTDISLLELSNSNSRLLKEFATKAPGTFQHSLQVANLAEEAIYRIGGNALLVRTGALYHDIGKMYDPYYFTENQNFGVNPHEKLTYEESAKKIINHVKKGEEIAKKHRIPSQLIDFIKTHHGTKKAEYFYLMEKKDNPDIEDKKYIYPGPIPASKEMAVMMMADAVEAASRSLKEANKETLNLLVDKIIDSQLSSGQFNNADITLKEIAKVKRIFKQKLLNLYHVRLEYPEE